ncbi:MAG: DUF4339 domain-containing protein [Microcystis aeruginosa S11-01]|jgi:hypothetical protein|nr:DUF4339 domain-containing protein [Microcystis aeruginosa S11-05]NCR50537.1 DUF4339 domain-containing protein [Microcystis aeruginosa S11-01]
MKDQEEVYFNESGIKVTDRNVYLANKTLKIDEIVSFKKEEIPAKVHPVLWLLELVIVGIMIFHLYTTYQSNIFLFVLALIFIVFVGCIQFASVIRIKPDRTVMAIIFFSGCIILSWPIFPRIFFYIALIISSGAVSGDSNVNKLGQERVIITSASGQHIVEPLGSREATLALDAIEKAIEAAQNYRNLQEKNYSLRVSGETYGPYDLDTVRHLLTTRQINPNGCLFWKPGMIEWSSITEIPQLRELIPPPTQNNRQEPMETIAKKQEKPDLPQQEKTVDGQFKSELADVEAIDLNNAPLEDLLLLPNMTINKAENLIRERELRLGFSSIEEVAEFLRLQPHLVTKLKAKAVILAYQSENISDAQDQRLIDF